MKLSRQAVKLSDNISCQFSDSSMAHVCIPAYCPQFCITIDFSPEDLWAVMEVDDTYVFVQT